MRFIAEPRSPDQVHPASKPLAQLAVCQGEHPQRGDQIAAAELGQHAGVDLVGLAGQRGDIADLARVGDLHLPSRRGERVAHPDRAAHHLHHGPNVQTKYQHKPREAVLVGRHRSLTDHHAALAKRTPRGPPIRPVDPEILHPRACSRGLDTDQGSICSEEAPPRHRLNAEARRP
jgi:hypothetical protein